VLTPTEWRVVHAVQHGMSNREIAERRGVSLDAVKFHVSNVLGKLGLANRQALRRWFRVPAASALGRRDHFTMTTTTLGPLAQISRTVRDIKESEAFYGTALGLPHLYSFGSLAFFARPRIHSLSARRRHPHRLRRAAPARCAIQPGAAPHSSSRGRNRGMAGALQ
jgi:DNA-binding CsgD family transcriptional regulator